MIYVSSLTSQKRYVQLHKNVMFNFTKTSVLLVNDVNNEILILTYI